jgi:hypothetical protein
MTLVDGGGMPPPIYINKRRRRPRAYPEKNPIFFFYLNNSRWCPPAWGEWNPPKLAFLDLGAPFMGGGHVLPQGTRGSTTPPKKPRSLQTS